MRLRHRLGLFFALITNVCAIGAQTLPHEVELGRDWLASQIQSDGIIMGEAAAMATTTQTRAEVIDTLRRLNVSTTTLAAQLVQQAPDSAVEHLARQIIVQAASSPVAPSRINQLMAYQNADGGFGGTGKFASNILDTSFALIALRAAGQSSGDALARAVSYLAERVGTLDNSGLNLDAGSRPYVASYALLALQTHATQFSIAQAIEAARSYLLAQQGSGSYAETLLNAISAIALSLSSTSGTGLDDLRAALRASQMPDGSWANDPYLTALALRGLMGSSNPPPPQTARINATVREAQTLVPIAGATATLTGASSTGGSTAPDGRIVFPDLPPGTYALRVEKPGFVSVDLSAITVVASQSVDLGFIDLNRASSNATLRGLISDIRDGSPVAGATVAIQGAASQQVLSSPDGRYEIISSAAGTVAITVTKAGFQVVEASGTLALGHVLEFSPSLYPDGFTPPTTAVLAGTVVSADGDAPIAGANIQVGTSQVESGANGSFQLPGLTVGAVSASVSANGFLSAHLTGTLAPGVNNVGLIRLVPDQPVTTSTVTGRITDADNGTSIAGALIEVAGSGLRASSGTDGRYQIAGIPEIPFTLTTTAAGYQSRSATAGSQVHGSFVADMALNRLTGGDFALESVVMSAAEYPPYGEAAVVGTVRNLGTEEAGLVFNAIVLDSNQQITRDVPAVRLVFNSNAGDNILPVAAGATRSVTIIWGTLDDAPGDYSVLFRGVNPNGQVAVEGTTTYRTTALTRIGGSVTADPPLLQAGLGQTVGLSARLTNLGNLPIPSGDADLSVTLVRPDSRPPAPQAPVMGLEVLGGAPLNRPLQGVVDHIGNVYTINRFTRELVKVAPDGSASLLRVLGAGSGPNGIGGTNMSQIADLAMHPDGALRLASTTGWVTRVELTAPYLQSSTQLPVSSVSAYVVDPSGNEYVSGTYQGHHRVMKRSSGGLLSVVVDAGISNPGGAAAGIDGHLYITNDAQGVIYRVDSQSGVVAPFASGLTRPNGIVSNPDGSFFIAESTTGKIRRLAADGVLTDFAEGLPAGANKLVRGDDGQLYWLNGGAGEIRRIDSQGVPHPFASGLVDRPVRVLLDSENRLVAASSSQIRRRLPDGSQETLAIGLSAVRDFLEESPDQFLVAQPTAIRRVSAGAVTTVVTVTGETIVSISKSQSGDVFVWTVSREQRLYRLAGSNLELIFVVPQGISGVARSPQGPVLFSAYGIYRIDEDGRSIPIATGFGGLKEVFTSATGELYAYDNGGSGAIAGLFRIDVASASAHRITERLPSLVNGIAVDSAGRVLYGKGRSIDRLDPATTQVETVATLDSTQYVYYLSIDHLDRVYFGSQGSTLMRLEGASQTQVATQVTSTLVGSDGRLWIRRAAKLYRLGDQDQEELRYTLPGSFSDVALLEQDLPLLFRGSVISLDFMDASAAIVRTTNLPREVTSMRVTPEGVFVRDGGSRLTRFSTVGAPTRLIGDSPGVRDLETDAGVIYASRNGGIYRLEGDGSLSSYWARTTWNANEYVLFSVKGALFAAANSISQELVLERQGSLVATLAPIQNATGFAQRADGSWISLGTGTIVETSPDGLTSRQLNRNPSGLKDVTRSGAGELLALSATIPLVRLDADGGFVRLAALREDGAGYSDNPNLLVSSAQSDFSISVGGNVFKRNGAFLEPFSAGIGSVSDMDIDSAGRLYVADAISASIGRVDQTGYRRFASGFGGVDTLAVISDNAILAANGSSLILVNAQGAWSRALLSPLASVPKLSRIDGDTAWLIEEGNNRIREISIPPPLPLLPAGTVVHQATRSFAPLGLSGSQSLDFGVWLPQVGGDYEITVKPANAQVGGQATTGIHVGPNAAANLSVIPSNVPPGTRQVRGNAHIEGGDFSSLSRIDPSQLQLLLPNSVYPPAMGMDSSGALWYVTGGFLYRSQAGQAGLRMGSLNAYAAIRGEVPIDSQQRAYAARRVTVSGNSVSEIRRVDQSGNSEVLASFPDIVVSMTIDGGDSIYVLVADKILHVTRDGMLSEYISLPNGTPYGMTRDGAGNIYVQMLGNIIYRIDLNRDLSAVLTDARFEYEGVNIAGTCAEGLFFTPNNYDRVGQYGEEYTLAQVLGSTGEIGPILNGQVISDDLLDMDFVVYDRFASRILVMSESSGAKIFSLPVTCGAIDVDLHIVLTADQSLDLADPPASQTISLADGRTETVWALRDVNRQGIDLSYLTSLTHLARGESRQVAQEAWLEFRNTFTEGTIRLPIQVPSVTVADLVDIDVATDLPSYPQNSNVDTDVFLRNLDDVGKSGRLWVRVEDAAGALVETLIDRAEVFGPLEERELDPPFNSGSNRVGNYRLVAEILDEGDRVVAHASSDFDIVAGGSGASVSSTVRTDQGEYRPQETVTISAEVRNLGTNQGFTALTVRERILGPDTSLFASFESALANLEPDAVARLEFPLPLGAAPAGRYRVEQTVLDSAATVLSSVSAEFDVLPELGNQALSGALTVDPALVVRGGGVNLGAEILNRGNSALTAVPLKLQVLDPANGNGVVAEWIFSENMAPGQTVLLTQVWSTAGVPLGDYIVTVQGAIGAHSVVLDQKLIRVVGVVLGGTLAATPAEATPADTIALSAQASNSGNLAGNAIVFRLEVLRTDSNAMVREWNYSADLAPGESLSRVESATAASLGVGVYLARWSAEVGGQLQVLAEAGFAVRDIQISGTIEVSSTSVELNAPVQLLARIRNLGNLSASNLPVRVEVRRLDTQTVIDSWNETANIASDGTHLMSRQWQSATAGDFQAVVLAQFAGAWNTLSTANFTVNAAAVDVDMQMAFQRDARLLVLVSCAPGESASGSSMGSGNDSDPGRSQTPSACELARKTFLDQYLSQLAVDHKVVTSDGEFMSELRCGHYNTYWLSGGSEKLAVADAKELRETIYRGDGLMIDGSHDQRTSFIDEMSGYNYRGHLPQPDLTLRGAGTLLPVSDVATYGNALHLETSTGQVEASFIATSTPAVISNVFGQGHALSYAFDLVEVLQRDSAQPASARLFDNGLVFVAPTVVTPDFAPGAYIPVTTTVENRTQGVDLRLKSSVNSPASVLGSAPTPTSADAQSSTWDFNLAASQQRSFDLNVLIPPLAATGIGALSELSRRNGPLLEPLSNVSQPLAIRDVAATSTQLLAELNAANLGGGERAARDRAVRDIGDALQSQAEGEPYAAIGHWIDAAEEIVRITSVPTESWRLANARLLEISQHGSCGLTPPSNSCDVLGVAGDYNAFVFENYTASSSDVQGRLAAGGNISLNNYSIGDQLPATFTGPSLVAGGNLQFPSGRVYYGDIVVGGSAAGVGSAVTNGLGPNQQLLQNAAVPIDFVVERARLTSESTRLATLAANTTWENQWGGLYLHGDNQSALQVFNLPGTEVLNAHTFAVDRIPVGATVLFNISGVNTGLTNMSMSSLIPFRNKVLFNFYQATALQLQGISVEGSVLAPLADINNPQGVTWGSVVAKSWNGMMQINLAEYSGCTAGGSTAPPSLCTTQPSAPVLVGAGQASFAPFAALERLEVRGGRKGAADWEWGLGTNTQTAGQFVHANLDWISGKSYRFVLSYNGQGNGRMQVFDGLASLFVGDFNANGSAGLRTGDALQLAVISSTGIGNATIKFNATQLNGKALTESIATSGNSSEARLTYFYPPMRSAFDLQGTVRMDFPGNSPPTGSRLAFFATAGNLSCSGAAP
jgi:choice-of-anchor A domain-containing protein